MDNTQCLVDNEYIIHGTGGSCTSSSHRVRYIIHAQGAAKGKESEIEARKPTFVRFRIPAVSISVSFCPLGSVSSVSTASLVVPLMSQTIERSSPHMAFNRLLFPGQGGE